MPVNALSEYQILDNNALFVRIINRFFELQVQVILYKTIKSQLFVTRLPLANSFSTAALL